MTGIESQQKLLAEALEADGWKIIDRARNLADWARYEVWTIESLWRPVGLRAFGSFLIDPMPELPSAKRHRLVWAVEFTTTSPLDQPRASQQRIGNVGITHFNKGIVELIESLAHFRNKSG
jgi:hypothetical protein